MLPLMMEMEIKVLHFEGAQLHFEGVPAAPWNVSPLSSLSRREQFLKANAQLTFRCRQLLYELSYIYPIDVTNQADYVICGVKLPNSEDFQGKQSRGGAPKVAQETRRRALLEAFWAHGGGGGGSADLHPRPARYSDASQSPPTCPAPDAGVNTGPVWVQQPRVSGHSSREGRWFPDIQATWDAKDDGSVAVALGYTSHLVLMISCFLQIPLRYPVMHKGSRSSIKDTITDRLSEKERE
ncbi:UV radiation resistance-associated gene protein p63 [Takifugu flavidus]|uniref:UV radiation resistance-associated gene protein p63 n=1 Tax=Takifugu flavidus TaxID=433684 RepID=A0A5C6P5N5_9TELE|nr:UV radiation resistance-associated gene protein p63 [Takifugu flavidus]